MEPFLRNRIAALAVLGSLAPFGLCAARVVDYLASLPAAPLTVASVELPQPLADSFRMIAGGSAAISQTMPYTDQAGVDGLRHHRRNLPD